MLFRDLLNKNPTKYKELLGSLSGYWELRWFKPGEVIAITGEQCRYVNVVLEGEVHVFVPRTE